MKKTLVTVFLAVNLAAFAKPTHMLYHAGKGVSYPIRHPQKTGRSLWKLVKAVF